MLDSVELLLYFVPASAVLVALSWSLLKPHPTTLPALFDHTAAPDARGLMWAAVHLAAHHNADRVDVAHIAAVLSTQPAMALELKRCGLTLHDVVQYAAATRRPEPPDSDVYTGSAMQLWRRATQKAREQGDKRRIGQAALLAVVLESETPLARMLSSAGVQPHHLSSGEPPTGMHFVYTWNDPRTTMEHVSAVLQKQFELDHDAALAVTVAAHCSGFAAVGPYALSEAEDHIEAATEATFKAGHALCLSLEEPNIEDWMLTRQGLLPPETPRASSWD
ncbi:MAG: ATP-dependent Clp protease adaptor ClpS [Myxococcota bacterium]